MSPIPAPAPTPAPRRSAPEVDCARADTATREIALVIRARDGRPGDIAALMNASPQENP